MSETDAFVHVSTEAGELTSVLSAIGAIDAVDTLHAVTGEYDVIVQLDLGEDGVDTHEWLQSEIDEAEREASVQNIVEEVRSVRGVSETTTALAFAP